MSCNKSPKKDYVVANLEEAKRMYFEENATTEEIAKYFNVGQTLICKVFKEFGVKKTQNEISAQILSKKIEHGYCKEFPLTKEELYELYINKHMSAVRIGELYGISDVSHFIKIFGILKNDNQIKEDAKIFNNEKYGTDYPTQSDDVKEKTKKTCIEKYGETNPTKTKEVKDKISKTNVEKYGVNCVFKSEEIKDKIKNTNIQKYGYGRPAIALMSDETISILETKESFENYIKNNNFKTTYDIKMALGCAYSTVYNYVEKYNAWYLIDNQSSRYETEISNFLNDLNIYFRKDRKVLSHKEIDFYCPDYNIGIEMNGDYFHSNLRVDKNYHINKSKEAENKGIRLIHIYEYEWNNPIQQKKIKSMLKIAFGKVESRVYARECEIREITNNEAKPFNDKNHLQGHKNAQVTYGLFYNDNLMQLMSFSYNKKKQWWEIERGCPASNNIVVGGVSKLFKHFVKDYDPQKVFSYCDFNKFDGNGYESIGMKFIGYTGPDMKWLFRDGTVVGRNPLKHKEYQKAAFAQIYGSGSKKYLWTKENN